MQGITTSVRHASGIPWLKSHFGSSRGGSDSVKRRLTRETARSLAGTSASRRGSPSSQPPAPRGGGDAGPHPPHPPPPPPPDPREKPGRWAGSQPERPA